MKNILFFGLLLLISLTGCSDGEDTLLPSDLEKDWLVLKDNPDDAVDHARFLIFDQYGVSTYYNDTVAMDVRTDLWGGEFVYYERLQVFYAPGSNKPNGSFVLLPDKNALLPILEYVRGEVLHRVPDTYQMPAILFVQSLNSPLGDEIYRGFNTLAVRIVDDFENLDAAGKKIIASRLLGGVCLGTLLSVEALWMKDVFYNISKSLGSDPDNMYSWSAYWGVTVAEACAGTKLERTLAALGFLEPMGVRDVSEEEQYTPLEVQDILSYCKALFTYTPAEFEALHGNSPVIMKKYKLVKGKLESYGFRF